ncbi:ATP synthase F1 subunit delta [Epilithonimonas arachidiradicis]|uniref:ATP synthase subunit delta n=1 Tax=Epilithonimonas arachidiradicis TaxID=1617282 RepID=A0A420DBH2_9FLAO|nr:ATP synthase F1 subunit delta [Epilithonimonas arachidiradicis]RKE88860.1 F-type H+-transporting ATPase subunit delta [Epilithonimonas arachidiradicis]GGG54508.1 ATP synthase subunit delta [Epilithonimonas arachidiradicis]
MLTSKVAKRYAQGLLDFTQESGKTESVFAEMKDVVKIMSESKELNQFLNTPFIDARKKDAVALEIFKNFSSVSKNIIRLVIKQGREAQLKNIAQEFINKVEDIKGTQRISLVTASKLSEQNIQKIIADSNMVNVSNYDLETIIKPEILGGYILRVGDQQIDASVKTKLNNIKKEFQLN